ncbi:hypothetical protein RHSIM_Rhsim05G0120000 [Rhododendron simsii]|uniref:Uncharacterized protein n=1 Tax=Rhododendron simsii TaxID=118357 RepID=A0A834GXE2_RHOSS|nr:hypothetical protein RHSIM_Rhsim05G0120000 [Rhododendron simsii]
MSSPGDNSTTNALASQENLVSTVVSSIASILPPKPPTLGDIINEDVTERKTGMEAKMVEAKVKINGNHWLKEMLLVGSILTRVKSMENLKSDIFGIYDGEWLKAIKAIEKIQSRAATDKWTSSNKKRGSMVITGHYVDDSWKFIYVPYEENEEGEWETNDEEEEDVEGYKSESSDDDDEIEDEVLGSENDD